MKEALNKFHLFVNQDQVQLYKDIFNEVNNVIYLNHILTVIIYHCTFIIVDNLPFRIFDLVTFRCFIMLILQIFATVYWEL